MKKKGKLILTLITIAIIPAGYILMKDAFNYLSGYLSKSGQVKANILLVEGWLPDYALNLAFEEFQKNKYEYIITTGLKYTSDYYNVFGNGYLTFYPGNRFKKISESRKHSIEIDAFSEVGGNNRAHFNLFINDSLAADFLAEKRKRKYGVIWEGNLKDLDSILIQFTNDGMGDYGDRNLYVKEIIIDHKTKIPYLRNSEYALAPSYGIGRIKNSFNSAAELARNWFLSMGIDSSLVIAVPGERSKINRTLTSAIAFRDWLKKTNVDIRGINVITVGTHARRTWMTYNKILNEKYDIGIISIPDKLNIHSREIKFINTLRETIGIIYYWILLIPY